MCISTLNMSTIWQFCPMVGRVVVGGVISIILILYSLFRIFAPVPLAVFAQSYSVEWKRLESSKFQGDFIGDAFYEEIGTAQLYKSNDLLTLASTSGPAGAAFLERFKDTPPDWINLEMVQRGADFQSRWIDCFGLAGLGAIIESYGYNHGSHILAETGRLMCAADATRRLLETAIFNIRVVQHGLYPGSSAMEAVARVRLLHCMVRKHVRTTCSAWWDETVAGVPVNQEDGVHTLFLQSHASIRAMEMQGLPITAEEKDAISMFWCYCGYLLGIDEEFLPRSYQDEVQCYIAIFERSFNPAAANPQLTRATVEGFVDLPPYHLSHEQVHALIRLTLGPAISDRMGIDRTVRWRDACLVTAVRAVTFTRWLIYCTTGITFGGVEWMRGIIEGVMAGKGLKPPQWRFLLARKKYRKDEQ